MKNLKLTLIVLLSLSLNAFSQNDLLLPKFYRPLDSTAINQSKAEENVDFGLSMGTGISAGSGYSMMNSYIAPNVNVQVNPNLQLNFQGVISNMNMNPLGNATGNNSPEMFKGTNNNSQSFAFSGGGVYQPNEKFYISAQGQVAQNTMQPFNLYSSNNQSDMDYKSFSLGMGYKISENTHLNFQIRFEDSQNPYYNSYHNPYYSPFSSFSRGYNPFFR